MEWQTTPVTTATQFVMKPEGKRLRRKLQKISNPLRNSQTTNCPTAKSVTGSNPAQLALEPNQPYHSSSPDLSDPKWFDYVHKSGHYVEELPSPPLQVIPELAHLSINDEKPRTLVDTRSSDNLASSTCTPLSTGSMRRYAKTPVFRIGQLERPLSRNLRDAQKVTSVELIAESYRALLDSRCSMFSDRNSAQTPSVYEDAHETLQTPDLQYYSADEMTTGPLLSMPSSLKQDMGSPASDDGTLVGFEEDAIYFKPVSLTPEASSPLQDYRSSCRSRMGMSTNSETVDDPSFQICLDLLTRELSSAVSGSPLRPSDETSALQIWVMIEAYEKLRDQVVGLEDTEQARSMGAMFDTWLRALYALHDKLMGNDGDGSESDYGEE